MANLITNRDSHFINELESFFNEKDFKVSYDSDSVELETWTNGGVNMFIHFRNTDEFFDYVNNFNSSIDNEIVLHRQDTRYIQAFTLRESLKDFNSYDKRIKKVATKFKKLLKTFKKL